MSLLKNLKASCSTAGKAEWRQYVELLKANSADAEAAEAVLTLMPKLDKRHTDVEADRQILTRAGELKGIIGAGKKSSPKIAQANAKVSAYIEETNKILAERQRGMQDLQSTASGLSGDRERAIAAINELNELKLRHACLLEDEPAVKVADLD